VPCSLVQFKFDAVVPQGGREEFAALTNRVFTARGGSGRFLTQS
jgi:hypothetical protein